jgi:hypothetical protein
VVAWQALELQRSSQREPEDALVTLRLRLARHTGTGKLRPVFRKLQLDVVDAELAPGTQVQFLPVVLATAVRRKEVVHRDKIDLLHLPLHESIIILQAG